MDEDLAELQGESPAIEVVRDRLRRILNRLPGGQRLPAILLCGETGTGKGLVARLIHRHGPRRSGPFVDVNCAAIPETMLEAELFGFERGAFTDAARAKPGLLQAAHHGMLFLDEVGLMSGALQAKLLTAIEDRVVRRLGSTRPEPTDAWVISATNTDLEQATRARRFREDLYHRLAVITLELPPLRVRGRDVVVLAQRFLARTCAEYQLPAMRLGARAEGRLLAYPWPGNVRELANVIERAALFADSPVVTEAMLELPANDPPPPEAALTDEAAMRERLLAVLEQTGWNIAHTAALLGVTRNTVYARIDKLGLRREPGRARHRRPAPPKPAAASLVPSLGATDEGEDGIEPSGALVATRPAPAAGIEWARRRIALLRVRIGDGRPAEPASPTTRTLDGAIDKVQSFGGRVEELSMAGLLAAFGLEPVEDAPRRAAHAALAMHKSVERAREAGGEAPEVRIVLHAADLLIGRSGGRLEIDADARQAARTRLDDLLTRIDAGVTVASAEAAPFLERRFELAPLGDTAYRLTGRERRGLELWGALTKFVGRDDELALLRDRFARARAGHGQLVAVVGEPGVGKSRLFWEFTHSPDVRGTLLEAGAVSYGQATPYSVLTQLLRLYFRIDPSDDARCVREKVTAKPALVEARLRASLSPLLALLDVPVDDRDWAEIEPRERRRRMLDAARRLLLRESEVHPLILVVEDLHWIDAESQAFLDALVESLPAARIMLLVNFRPEYHHGWGAKACHTQLQMQPLPPSTAGELLDTLLGADPALAPVKRLLIERTEGNPFFLEESVRTLLETGALAGERGALRLVQPVITLQVPATVETVLASRIDRLPADDKRLLQAAAVIGTDVPLALLQLIADRNTDELHRSLAMLESAGFLDQALHVPEATYSFKHALTHQVAYQSLLKVTRQDYHARIARALAENFPAIHETQPELLAYHYTEAGLAEPAIEWWERAGRRANGRSAYADAIRYFRNGLDLLVSLPDTSDRARRELRLHLGLAPPLMATKDYSAPELEPLCGRAVELCHRLGDDQELFRVLSIQWPFYLQRGPLSRALEIVEQLEVLARSPGPEYRTVMVHSRMAMTLRPLGEFARARAHAEQGLALYDPTRHRASVTGWHLDWGIGCLAETAVTLWHMGYPDQSLRTMAKALAQARALAQPFSLVWALTRAATHCGLRREPAESRALAEESLMLARKYGFEAWVARGEALLGCALAAEGQTEEGIALTKKAHQVLLAMGDRLSPPLRYLTLLAGIHLKAGRTAEGLDVVAEAFALAAETGYRETLSELHRIDGELRLATGADDAGEASLQQALAIAREQQARSWELRAAMSLARLWQRQGRKDEARSLLAEIYGWFTEGFGTPDLRDARALLDDLG